MPSIAPSPNKRFRFVAALVDRLDIWVRRIALWGGGAMLLALAGLTVVEVIRRYFFNAPIHGARDVAKLALLTMVALSVAYSARTGGQVAIELFSQRMGQRWRHWTAMGTRVAGGMMLMVMAVRLWTSGVNAGRFGEASLELGISHTSFYWILCLGMALYGLVLFSEAALRLTGRGQSNDGSGR
jgi:TRAP-type C4-dicarboxylate transport system permease small subunit